ncbi:MAG TPA: rod shape-determining protein [Candidatus Nitrosocosmicus sp.]|nr:rod shape-determining protein [Candidatus Nitrosocosmicus sp.]
MKNIIGKITDLGNRFLSDVHIAVDIGTSNTRMAILNKGIVLREPTYIGQNVRSGEYLFFGQEAKEIYGKAPNFINVTKPIQNGIISDFDANVLLMKYFLEKSVFPFFLNQKFLKSKINAYTVVPTSSTEVEQRAIQESLVKAGVHNVSIIEKPLASAFGSRMPIFTNKPIFSVDMGGGIIEIAVIFMGGIVNQKILKIGGDYLDKAIYNYLHLKNGIIIGDQTAENLKINLFTFDDSDNVMTIRGKSLEDGLPKSLRVKSGDIREALATSFNHIIDAMKEVVETIPPEIVDGIIKNGVVLSGGLADIKGIDKYFSKELKIPVIIPDNPSDATINGIVSLMNNKEKLKQVIL